MVWSSVFDKRRADSTPHSAPPPPAGNLEVEEPLYEKRIRLHKRARDASTSSEQVILAPDTTLLQALYNNVLGEPGPLGLRLRKSPSLLDMIQMMPSQSNADKTLCVTSLKGSKVGEKSNFSASLNSLSKIKASHFHASLLRIGTWEFVSRSEGDLVAKCYFAKSKLLWEFLEGGLKSKIEFHWFDITAIKTVFFEGGHGALDIVLARPPLFFREIDPQPRKHIQWQATQDFTNGQACIHRRHLLQCPQTSLSKNFEKLIDCDPHLKQLSQQPDIILESPYFDPLLSQQHDIILESSYIDPLLSQQSDIILESLYFDHQYHDVILESSYFDPQYSVLEDQNDFKSHINEVIKDDSRTTFSDFYKPGPPSATSSISNKAETQDSLGRTPAFDSKYTPSPCSVEELASGNTSLPCDTLFDKQMDYISQLLDNDSQSSVASDEQSIISRVNSLRRLIQQDTVTSTTTNSQVNDQDGNANDAQVGAGSYDEPYSTPKAELLLEFMMIPRVASFPRVLSQSYLM
ncbi:hypothetical protein ZIOFF_012074 [Zingiber officinale]|uniref:TRF2/HOY1 PH-like domain-containing protein n=1 Tax=Zingiber officinale TaxID=94328 RepID=A0A8J5HNX0_ZINOF|nr:hypothetical protein ZIOFF_012074 [Zingiber officinale]